MLLNNILVQMRQRMAQQQAQQGATPPATTPPQQPPQQQQGGLNQLLGMNPMWGAFGQTRLGGMLNGMLGQARLGPAMGMGQNILSRLGLGGHFPGGQGGG